MHTHHHLQQQYQTTRVAENGLGISSNSLRAGLVGGGEEGERGSTPWGGEGGEVACDEEVSPWARDRPGMEEAAAEFLRCASRPAVATSDDGGVRGPTVRTGTSRRRR